MMKPIVINKFRLGDRSERIAALADEWGCSVTVATARLLDAGLAAVDRDQRMTPDAIRAGFSELDRLSIDDWVAQKSTPDAVSRGYKMVGSSGIIYTPEALAQAVHSYDGPASLSVASNGDVVGEITMDAIEAAECLMPAKLWLPGDNGGQGMQPQGWPTLPDTAGKRMFDEAARHAFEAEYSGKFETVALTPEELRTAILNGYPVRSVPSEFWGGSPTEADQNYASAKADFDAYRRRLGFPSAACGGWGSGLGIPTIEDIDAIIPTTPEAVAAEEERQRLEGPTELPESLRDGSKVLERIKYLEEIGAPLKINFGLQITDATRDAMSGKGAFVDDPVICVPDESCPGCGCQPGDGPTEGCEHPDGCGYYEDQDPRSMGWVGDNGLP